MAELVLGNDDTPPAIDFAGGTMNTAMNPLHLGQYTYAKYKVQPKRFLKKLETL